MHSIGTSLTALDTGISGQDMTETTLSFRLCIDAYAHAVGDYATDDSLKLPGSPMSAESQLHDRHLGLNGPLGKGHHPESGTFGLVLVDMT